MLFTRIISAALISCVYPLSVLLAEPNTAPIKIGAIFSVSGWAAIGGQVELNATLMAAEEVNKSGGVLGRKLEVVYEDNRSDLAATVGAFNKLVTTNKVAALLGPNWAEFAEVVAPLAERKKLPMLTASGFSWTLTKGRRFVFTNVPNFKVQVRPLANYIVAKKHKKVVLLHSASTYFDGISEATRDVLKEAGSPLYKYITVNPKEVDYRTLLIRLQKEGADAVILYLQEGGDVPAALRQMRELEYMPARYAYDLGYDEVLSKDWHKADGVVFFAYTGHFDESLRESYRKRFAMEPPWTVPKAYDNVFILKAAIEKCGVEPEKIRECLSATDYQGTSGRIRYLDGVIVDAEEVTTLKQIVDGKVIALK